MNSSAPSVVCAVWDVPDRLGAGMSAVGRCQAVRGPVRAAPRRFRGCGLWAQMVTPPRSRSWRRRRATMVGTARTAPLEGRSGGKRLKGPQNSTLA